MPTAQAQFAVGDLRVVALQGGGYANVGSSSVNDSGTVVFAADLTGSTSTEAIVRVADGRHTVLVRSGEQAPGGGLYDGFGELDLGDDGSLLFQARLSGSTPRQGLFLRAGSGTQAVAHAGPDCDYASFDWLTLTSYTLASGSYFSLAYAARLADGRRSLVMWPSFRKPRTILTTGEPFTGGVLEDFTVSRMGLALCVVARIRRDGTSRRVALLVSEDQVIWGARVREGAQFPGQARISRLLGKPGMYVHHGFVAAELDDGATMLAVRPCGGNPEVFANAGEPAPGVAGRSISRFGQPLANHGLLAGGPCGIVSVVTLDSGVRALWLGVFVSQQPMAGATLIPMVAGDHLGDEPASRVAAFTPVKLTNTGILLLRSTLDSPGRRTEGLLLLDGLFDGHPIS